MVVLHAAVQFISVLIVFDEPIDFIRVEFVIEDVGCRELQSFSNLFKPLHHDFEETFVLV
jgi:hypothetical protein